MAHDEIHQHLIAAQTIEVLPGRSYEPKYLEVDLESARCCSRGG
jgi:hypothetical protein